MCHVALGRELGRSNFARQFNLHTVDRCDSLDLSSQSVDEPTLIFAPLAPCISWGEGAGGEGQTLHVERRVMKRKNADSEQERISFARSQRRSSNEFADLMWQCLRNRQVLGKKFRREHSIPPYTVDFFCAELGLIVEVDGEPHMTSEGIAYDQRRDQYLSEQGYHVLRIPGYGLIREDGRAVERVMGVIRELEESSA